MPKSRKYLLLLLLFTTFLTACKDKKEVDRITSPVALGIDWDEKSNMINVYAQVSTISSASGGQSESEKTFRLIEGQGETLVMAMTDIIDHSQQYLAWDHLYVIIISNKMAEHGISDSLDYLVRLDQVRLNCYLLIADDDLKDLLGSTPIIQTGISTPLAGVSLISEISTHSKVVTLRDFVMPYLCKESSPFVPIVSIYKEVEKQQRKEIEMDYNGFGVFRKDKLIGNLDESNALGLLIILGLKDQGSMVIPDTGGKKDQEITISGLISNTKIIPYMQQNKPGIHIQIEAEYDISEVPDPKKMDIHDIDKINLQVAAYMKKQAEEVIKKAQLDLKSDVFGFGGKVYRKYPNYWLKNMDNWQEIFPTLNVTVESKAKLDNTGFSISGLKHILGKD